jgi:ABC-type Fe3+/spermidine/putrescine transport system ATPase subunit
MAAILEVHDLVKKYGDFAAVKGISFDIQEGEVFSLLGPNGAGKTTTISVLSTLYAPTGGDAIVGGHSVTREPMAVRTLIGVVPQDLALYEDLTARENLSFWGQMYGLSGKALRARIDTVLEQIGLADRAGQGMRRRWPQQCGAWPESCRPTRATTLSPSLSRKRKRSWPRPLPGPTRSAPRSARWTSRSPTWKRSFCT